MTKGRGLVVFLALTLTTLATAGVVLYSIPVEERTEPGAMVPVVVSEVDIPARTTLNELIKDGQFKIIRVPESVVVNGAITSINYLRGKSNSVLILTGEQIPAGSLRNRAERDSS